MRICFSVLPGGAATLSSHFGETGHYVVYDSETRQLEPQACHAALCRGPCRCFMPEMVGIDLVVCRAIGHLALRALRSKNTPVYQTRETHIETALAAWQSGQLTPVGRAFCKTGRRTAARTPVLRK